MAGPECKTGTTHHPTLSYRLTELLEALLTPVFLPLSAVAGAGPQSVQPCVLVRAGSGFTSHWRALSVTAWPGLAWPALCYGKLLRCEEARRQRHLAATAGTRLGPGGGKLRIVLWK